MDEPPLTPLAALSYTLVISCVSSSDAEKRKIAGKAMQRIESLEKTADKTGRCFLHTAWPLVVSSGIAIGNSNKSLNRELEKAAKCRDSKISQFKEIRNMRTARMEKSKLVVNVPSMSKWLASIGVSAAAIYMLEKEIVGLVAIYMLQKEIVGLVGSFSPLADVTYLAYCVATSFVIGAFVGARKLINQVLNRKQETAVSEFHEKKSKVESKFNGIAADLFGKHMDKAVEIAANAFSEVCKLCEAHYPKFLNTDAVLGPVYRQYLEIKNSNGEGDAYGYLMEIGKQEAHRQLASMKFLQDFTFSASFDGQKQENSAPGGAG